MQVVFMPDVSNLNIDESRFWKREKSSVDLQSQSRTITTHPPICQSL